MNIGLACFILGVVASLAKAKSYSLPYKASDRCKDGATEYLSRGYCCSKCRPGTRKSSDCTQTTDTACEPCPAESFTENMNYHPNCFSCNQCRKENGMVYLKQCTSKSNAECECMSGYFCDLPKESCPACERHKKCNPGKGALEPGTSTRNVRCGSCPNGTFSNETSSHPCRPHTRCDSQGRSVLTPGTDKTDAVCGPVLSVTHRATHPPLNMTGSRPSPAGASTRASTRASTPLTSLGVYTEFLVRPPDATFTVLWTGLAVAALLLVLLIAGFCIYSRKAVRKPAVYDDSEARHGSNSAESRGLTEQQGLLGDSSTDPSTSSSSDSQSQGAGVSQDLSPVLNLSITATFNCQVNPTTGSCSIPAPFPSAVHVPSPEFPLSQEEELGVSCEQEDSKDAIQSVQESGMTKY